MAAAVLLWVGSKDLVRVFVDNGEYKKRFDKDKDSQQIFLRTFALQQDGNHSGWQVLCVPNGNDGDHSFFQTKLKLRIAFMTYQNGGNLISM